MGRRRKEVEIIGMMVIMLWGRAMCAGIDCSTMSALVSTCSIFLTYGTPDPLPGTPCCDAMISLRDIADSELESKRFLCACLMNLIALYNPNSTAIATLPGFCCVSLGFDIDPDTNCSLIT